MTNDEFNNLPTSVLVMALVALLGGIFVIILDEFQETEVGNITQTNDSINSSILGTSIDLNAGTHTYFIGILNETLTVFNESTELSPDGNITVTESTGALVFLAGGIAQNNTIYNISFTYQVGSAGRDTFAEGTDGIAELVSWLDLIALIIAASIIMYLILRNFGVIGGGKGNQGQGY